MIDKELCKQCICNNCGFDYGESIGSVFGSHLCRNRTDGHCHSCQDNTQVIIKQCEEKIPT